MHEASGSDDIATEDVALFMKGTPQFVMCGNSMRALEALRNAGASVTAVDVLPDLPPEDAARVGVDGDPTATGVFSASFPRRYRRSSRRERSTEILVVTFSTETSFG